MPAFEPHVIPAVALRQCLGSSEVWVSARHAMAFAAGIGASRALYFDDVPLAPPSFVVALEWALLNGPTYRDLLRAPQEVMERAVHLTQASRFHRPIRAGTRVTTSGQIAALRQSRRGVIVTVALETADADGVLAHSTFTALVLDSRLDAQCDGERPTPAQPEPASPQHTGLLPVPASAAHIYTECSGIWNPIHTEKPAARRAGFDRPIVHGTWTWATTAEWAIDRWCEGDPRRLQAWTGRFVAPVLPGAPIALSGEGGSGSIRVLGTQSGGRCFIAEGELAAG